MKRITIESGEIFGKLITLERVENRNGRQTWKCICECGNTVYRSATTLKRENLHACLQCSKRYNATKHGMCNSKLYNIYNNMKQRCYNKNRPDYRWYGKENKIVCDEWLGKKGFICFKEWAIKSGYKAGLQIDRIDPNGNYEPNNCRWVDTIAQKNNTRRNHFITYRGETHTMAQWARIYGVDYEFFRKKVKKWEKIDVNTIFKGLERS